LIIDRIGLTEGNMSISLEVEAGFSVQQELIRSFGTADRRPAGGGLAESLGTVSRAEAM